MLIYCKYHYESVSTMIIPVATTILSQLNMVNMQISQDARFKHDFPDVQISC